MKYIDLRNSNLFPKEYGIEDDTGITGRSLCCCGSQYDKDKA